MAFICCGGSNFICHVSTIIPAKPLVEMGARPVGGTCRPGAFYDFCFSKSDIGLTGRKFHCGPLGQHVDRATHPGRQSVDASFYRFWRDIIALGSDFF